MCAIPSRKRNEKSIYLHVSLLLNGANNGLLSMFQLLPRHKQEIRQDLPDFARVVAPTTPRSFLVL